MSESRVLGLAKRPRKSQLHRMQADIEEAGFTGREIARAAAADFSSFFLPGYELEVAIEFAAVASACIRKKGERTVIVLPREMGDDVVHDADRFFFHLLMIGHEIAHLVHRHVDNASEQSDEDYHSLELWADFYGAKVMMTLVSYGLELRPMVRRFFPDGDLFDALDNIGAAVGLLVSSVYRENKKYPAKLSRVGLTSNGVTSFLRNYYGPERFEPILYFSVFKRVFSAAPVRELMWGADPASLFAHEPVFQAARWHRERQGDAVAITPGFHWEVLKFLHTTFDQSEEEMQASRDVRMAELKEGGYLRDPYAANEHSEPAQT